MEQNTRHSVRVITLEKAGAIQGRCPYVSSPQFLVKKWVEGLKEGKSVLVFSSWWAREGPLCAELGKQQCHVVPLPSGLSAGMFKCTSQILFIAF